MYYQDINEQLHQKKMRNGLNLVIIPRNNYYKTEINLAVNFGSMHQSITNEKQSTTHDIPAGTAHFLEHMIFENSSPKWQDVMSSPNISINASTNFKRTSFTMSTIEGISSLIPILLDTVQNISFSDLNLNKERKIISHEINMYDNNIDWLSRIKLLNNMYSNPAFTKDILGDAHSIKKIDSKLLTMCHRHYYTPDNMILVISGPVNTRNILDLVESNTKNEVCDKRKHYTSNTLYEPLTVVKNLDVIKKGNEYKTLIGIKLIPLPYLDLLDFKLALEIYLYFLHKEIISIMHEYNFEINLESSISKYFSNIIFIANTSKHEYVNYLLMTAKENLRKKKIDEEQLLHVVQKKSGEILSNMNSTNFLVKNYVNHYFEGVDFFNILDKLQNVQLSDVLAIDNVMFHKNNKSILLQKPE